MALVLCVWGCERMGAVVGGSVGGGESRGRQGSDGAPGTRHRNEARWRIRYLTPYCWLPDTVMGAKEHQVPDTVLTWLLTGRGV